MRQFYGNSIVGVIIPVILTVILAAIRFSEGYLLFHVLVELFAVIIGVLIAIIVFYMHKFTRNNFLLFLGIGFFWTAWLDLFHMLSYYGMNVYPKITSPNASTTLWIAARIFETFTIFIAPFIRFDRIRAHIVFILMGSMALGVYIATFLEFFPPMYIISEGLTPIKIMLEYLIITMSVLAIMIYRSKRGEYHPLMYRLIGFSLFFGILAESCFTMYTDVYGIMNFVGHIFKFISYWMIFRGIVVTALKEPFTVISKASNTYNAIPVPVAVVDHSGIIRQINKAAENTVHYQINEIIGAKNHTLFHPLNLDSSDCPVCLAITQGKYDTFEIEHEEKYTQYTISPIKVEGEVAGILQISIDMTSQREAERRALRDAALFKTIINTAPVRLFWKDTNSVILGCNDLFAQDAGFDSSESMVGKRDEELIWSDQAALYKSDDLSVIQTGEIKINYEEPQKQVKGMRWLSTSKAPLIDDVNGKVIGIVGAYADITHLREAQIKLQENEAFYRGIFSSVHEAIMIVDQYKIIDCNDLAVTLFEQSRDKLINLDIFILMQDIQCSEFDFSYFLDKALDGEYVAIKCSLKVNCDLEESKIIEVILSRFGHADENKLIMVMRDLTKQLLKEKIFIMNTRQAQMGEMISMIAHQWRQPLAIINAITTQIRFKAIMNDTEDHELIDNLVKIEQQSAHLSQTISDYRDFFRPDKPKEHFRVVSLIDHAINLIDHTLKNHSIRIENEHVYNPTLYTYRNEVLQVLIVLLKNSLDAFMENKVIGGEIIIAVRHEESYCVIEICDNAGGIPKEVMYKLFSPYFTTKSESFGTGLGLYMSRIIIEDHCAGLIQALSEGNRTTFSVKLPYEEEQ